MKLATLCYIHQQGRTLMLHRVKKEGDIHANKWNGLGGKLEPGESPEECVIREVEEESGLIVHHPQLRGMLTFPRFSKGEDWYVFLFEVASFSGQLIESPEGDLAWIEDEQLYSLNLWPGDRIFLRYLQQGHFFSGKFVYEGGELVDYQIYVYPENSNHESH